MPLRQLHPDPQADVAEAAASVDFIAVHGLNPRNKNKKEHAWDTWRTPPGPKGHLWLRDSLPRLLPDSRIFLYEYNAIVVYGNDRATFIDKANDLLEAIRIEREDAESRPIIFLGHSMGGLLIKQALINAHNNTDPHYKSVKEATSGLVFFATPHDGGDQMLVTLGGLAAKMARSLGFQKGDNLVKVLESGNMFSDIMSEHFRHQLLAYDIVSFWGASDDIVPRESARLRLPGDHEKIVTLEADHSGVCKFGGSETDQDNLKLVRANLKNLRQKALKKMADRHTGSTLLDSKRLPNHFIPLARNYRFTGRAGILDELKQKFFIRKQCQKLAIFGLGGVGKTQVALQFAYWVKDNMPEYDVFWVSVLSDASFDQAYTELARRLQVQASKVDKDLKESVHRYLSLESVRKWLMIVDNADNHELLFGSGDSPGGIKKYLPQSDEGLILFTTRSREVAISAVGSDVIDLTEMSSEEATSFFENTIIQKHLLHDKIIIKELLHELTYLPLAITQAVAYLNRNQMSAEKYLGLLRGTEQGMVELLSREFNDETRYSGSQNAVATTWLVSFEEIRKSDSAAAELLSFISYIEPKAIPQSLFPNRWSDEEMEYAIGTLLGYAFMVRQDDEDMFDMHRLVHVSIGVWLQNAKQTENVSSGRVQSRSSMTLNPVTDEVVQHIHFSIPAAFPANRELWRQYLPHALRVLERSSECQLDERYELFYSVGRCLCEDRRCTEAVKALEEAHTWRRVHAYQDTNDQLELEDWLASAYEYVGRTEEAIKIYEKIAVIRRRELPDDDNERLVSEHGLASAYLDNGQIEEAIDILEHVVAIREKTLVEDDHDRLESELELAKAYKEDGRIKEAIEISERVAAIWKQTLREEDEDRLASEYQLAMTYLEDGRIKEAIKILEHVIAIQRQTLPEEDKARWGSEYMLATTYLKDGRTKEAIEILEHVVVMEKQILREEDEDRLMSEHELARAYIDDGRVKEAIETLEHVVTIRKQTLQEEDENRLRSEHELSSAYAEDGRVKEAIKILEHVVAIQKQTLQEEDENRLWSEQGLANLYGEDGRIEEAIEILEHVVAIQKQTLQEEDEDRLMLEHELAMAYLQDERIKEAVEIFEYVVAIRRSVLTEEDPARLKSEHDLAGAYLDDGKVQEAIILLEHIVAVEAKILAEDDPERVVSQELLINACSMI